MAVLEVLAAGLEKAGEVAAEAAKKSAEAVKEAAETGVREIVQKGIESMKNSGDAVKEKLDEIKNMTPEQLRGRMENHLETVSKNDVEETGGRKEDLSDEVKAKIKEETGWSDEIIDAIGSVEEYQIYKRAGLVEAEIGGKKCLISENIDWNQVDEKGRSNTERMERGLAPLDKHGTSMELHHIGQHVDSPLAELTFEEHRRGGNDIILHDKSIESEVHGEGNMWSDERAAYWKDRAEYNEGDKQR